MQFARDGDKVFLQDPERDDAVLARRCSVTSWTAQRCLERVALLSEDEDVGVEKATSGHRVSRNESHLD